MKRVLAMLMLVMVALSGCAEDDEGSADTQETAGPGHDDPAGGNETGADADANATIELILAFSADVTAGEDPVVVNFTIDVAANATWSLDFGDGTNTTGDATNSSATHTYAAGNHTATLTASLDDRSANAILQINVTAVQEEETIEPPVTYWEFGESLGCAPDGQGAGGYPEFGCISLIAGPSQPAVDGFWVPLGELYWGYSFVTTVENQRGDSDCFFVDNTDHVMGSANNSDKPCGGAPIPVGAEWLFLYSYAEPSTGQTMELIL